MGSAGNFLINLSVLHRNMQKYFDKVLAPYEIGSGQLMFLFYINEHEGVTMQEVTRVIEVDKGTTTKSIQKLIEEGYIQSNTDENDRRVRRLYTTQKAAEIMSTLYGYRSTGRGLVAQDIDFEQFAQTLETVCMNSRKYLMHDDSAYHSIKIGMLKKLSLNAYPGHISAVLYTGGCNYKCSFCNQKNMVFMPENDRFLDVSEVMEYLSRRQGMLDAICISGGEPLMQDGIQDLIREVKDLGYPVKIETNGYYPKRLEALLEMKLVDYVALDIKNCKRRYVETIGMNQDVFCIENVEESIRLLRQFDIPHEFCTTVTKELHRPEDLLELAKWMKGNDSYYFQQYQDGENVIQRGFTAYTNAELKTFQRELQQYLPQLKLRGVKEEMDVSSTEA